LPFFVSPGEYGVSLVYRNSNSECWPRARINIEVQKPKGPDAEALDVLEEDEELRFAMLSTTSAPGDELAERLRGLCRRFPKSSYAAYARFALARHEAAQQRNAAAIEQLDAIDFEQFAYGAAALWLKQRVLARDDAAAAAACRKEIDRLFSDAYETHIERVWEVPGREWQAMRDALITPEVPEGAVVLRRQPETNALLGHTPAVAAMPGRDRWLSVAPPFGKEPRALRISDMAERKALRTGVSFLRDVQALAVSPDGKWAALDQKDRLAVYDLATGEKVKSLETVLGQITKLAFAPDGSRLAIAGPCVSDRSTIYMIDPASWEVADQLQLPDDGAWRIAFSGDSRELIAGHTTGMAAVWRLDKGVVVDTLPPHLLAVTGVAYSPDNTLLAVVSCDGVARLWRRKNFELLREWRGHSCDIYDVAFSPDGKYLATTGYDRCAKLWDVASGKVAAVAVGHDDAVWSVAFARDGKSLVTRTYKGWVNYYDLAPLAVAAQPAP
jgi:hypothetical protein